MIKLEFDTMYNARDFAAALSENAHIRSNMLLRSDNTAKASQADVKKLLNYGVRTIVDIRSHKERMEEQDALELESGLRYHFVPFDSQDFAYYLKNDPTKLTVSLLEGYILLLEQKETVKVIFERIAEGLQLGGVLFHCSGGKDRTGLVAMLIQTILGVDRDVILSDYHDTYRYLRQSPTIQAWAEKYGERYIFCEPVLMEGAIRYLTETYSSVEGYLLACGISQETIAGIRTCLISQ